jgi:hypothetical protein
VANIPLSIIKRGLKGKLAKGGVGIEASIMPLIMMRATGTMTPSGKGTQLVENKGFVNFIL